MAVLMAILTQGLWWLFLIPAEAVHQVVDTKAPKLTYLRLEEMADDAGAQTLWSPILFSLPTPVGFSRLMMEGAGSLRPPLSAASTAELFFARESPDAPGLRAVVHEPLSNRIVQVLGSLASAERAPSVFADSEEAFEPYVTIEFVDGFLEEEFAEASLPNELKSGTGSWEVLAHLDVDEWGHVAHVFLERMTDSDARNNAIIRALHRWKLDRAGEARSGKVVVRFRGRPAAQKRAGNHG